MSHEVKLLPCDDELVERVAETIADFLDERFPEGAMPGGQQLFATDHLDAEFKHEAGCEELARVILAAIEAMSRPTVVTGERQGVGAIPGSREPDPSFTGSGPSGFDPERIGRWFSIADDGPPMPEVLVLCWDGHVTFVDWCGSKADFGCGVTHWMPYELPPGATNDMHDGHRAFASAGEAGTATTVEQGVVHEHAVAESETPNPGPVTGEGQGDVS